MAKPFDKRPEIRDAKGNLLCGAKKTDGSGHCTQPAGWGTSHPGIGACKMHFGATTAATTGAIREAVRQGFFPWLGAVRDMDPGEALLEEVHRTAGQVLELERLAKDAEDEKLGLAYLKEYNAQRAHMAKVAQMAIQAGVSERMVRLAEMQVDGLVEVLEGALADAGLSEAEKKRVKKAMAARIRSGT